MNQMLRLKTNTLATALLIATAGMVSLGGAQAGDTVKRPKAVLELYTSQGCNYCPRADALLGKYAGKPGYIALTLNVPYWDYLGWKDTLAAPANEDRQRDYARLRGDGQVYTPQIVVNGRRHVVGNNNFAVQSAIETDRENHGPLPVGVDVKIEADTVSVDVGDAPEGLKDPNATLWLVSFSRSETVPIGRGENRGATITYTNVVRDIRPIDMWKGKRLHVDLPRSTLSKRGVDGCAVLLQREKNGRPGAIIGAGLIPNLRAN